ncbi:MAG: hypothetical protein QM730_12695 [Anaerolineales bacterium]
MKTISIFLALINSLFAGLLIAVDISYYGVIQSIWWWGVVQIFCCNLDHRSQHIGLVGRNGNSIVWTCFMGGVFLIAVGPATLVWTVHVALTTGGIEYDMAVYGVSLIVQGLASLMGAAEARSAIAS